MMPSTENFTRLFRDQEVSDCFTIGTDSELLSLYKSNLFDPMQEFLSRPKKGFRAELVHMGQALAIASTNKGEYQITEAQTQQASLFTNVIEFLHAGSLIVDDIEDQSQWRRGKQTMHELYGIPIALNAGNWLYFWPLMLIQNADLKVQIKHQALFECHQTLLLAHTGQALDVGTPMSQLPRERTIALVMKSIELKSGVLTALAMKLGALTVLNSSEAETLALIDRTGRHIGQLLQFYDDIGNLTSSQNPQKQYEDLRLQRPSFIWSALAETSSPVEYQAFISDLKVTHTSKDFGLLVEKWQLAQRARAQATIRRDLWMEELRAQTTNFNTQLVRSINDLIERLSNAY
jgi:geranylgeranyl pyrophosphate synthase